MEAVQVGTDGWASLPFSLSSCPLSVFVSLSILPLSLVPSLSAHILPISTLQLFHLYNEPFLILKWREDCLRMFSIGLTGSGYLLSMQWGDEKFRFRGIYYTQKHEQRCTSGRRPLRKDWLCQLGCGGVEGRYKKETLEAHHINVLDWLIKVTTLIWLSRS